MKHAPFSLFRVSAAALWHRKGASLLLLLLSALGVFSAALLQNLALRQQESMTEMIKNTLIRCVVTDANDMLSDNIAMPASYVDRLLGGWHDRGCYLDEAVKNVRAKSAMPLNSPRDVTLCRILSLASDSAFDEVSGAQAVFFDGWSEDALAGTERVCLLPEFMLPQARTDGDGSLWLDVSAGEVNTSLRVIGTVSGQTGGTVWCPFYIQLRDGISESFRIDRCSFDIRDNARLEENKKIIYDTFVSPKLANTSGETKFGVFINDEEFTGSVREFESNLKTLRLLSPILLVLFAGVGFLAAYLTTRGRKREFAVMRCIGRKQLGITLQVFLEQLFLALVGAALGVSIALLIEGGYPLSALTRAGTLLGLFLFGAAAACLVVTRVNVVKLMKRRIKHGTFGSKGRTLRIPHEIAACPCGQRRELRL